MTFIAVDDEEVVLGVLIKAVKEAQPGCEISGFGSAREALRAIENGLRPDVAFLDVEMFGMNGLELAKRIRELSHNTKIIFVTGHPQYALEAYSIHAKGYLLKPATAEKVRVELEELKNAAIQPEGKMRVQTFGNFEVFMEGKPLRFGFSKTKELFAYLVDRRGAAVNTGELCAVLWEDNQDSLSIRSHLRTLIADLRRVLTEIGMSGLLIKSRNSFALDCDMLDCDLYRLLRRDVDALNAYMGEYMAQYSWAEMTLGELERKK